MRFLICAMLMLAVLSHASAARSQPAAAYPGPACTKPDLKLIGVQSEKVGDVWMPNNQRIRKFNEQAKAYNSCMHSWLDNAKDAVRQIQSKANNDIKQTTETANAAIKDIQDEMRAATTEASQLEEEQQKAIIAAKSSR